MHMIFPLAPKAHDKCSLEIIWIPFGWNASTRARENKK